MTTRTHEPPPRAAPGARAALAILTLINLFNYLDRSVVAAVAESLRRSEFNLSDLQLGSLATGFLLVYTLTSPAFGWFGDRGPRIRIIAAGIFVWSLATAAAGLAHSYRGLFVARAAVGIGEAAYATIAPSVLADFFPKSHRARVFAVFYAAIPIGSALGYIVGGLADARYGWRAAFFLAGFPGIALALLCLVVREPRQGAQDDVPNALNAGRTSALRDLVRNPPFVATVFGYALYTFALGGIAFWMPAFLERERGFSHADATVQFGKIVVLTGFVGTFVGGWLADWFLRRSRQAYLWVSGVATLLAAPAAYMAFASRDKSVALMALCVAEMLIFASTGPINSAIVNVVVPRMRGMAMAVSIFCIHVLGDVPSPPIIGRLSDVSTLSQAVLIVPIAVLLAGIVWCAAAWAGARRGWAA